MKGMHFGEMVMLGCKPYIIDDVLGLAGVAEALNAKLLINFCGWSTI